MNSQWTSSRLESLRGCSRPGCHTRQSSFLPFMLLSGCSRYELDTEPSLVRFWTWPGRSVSQERRGGGWPTARHRAAERNDWPSSRITGSREEMGRTEGGGGGGRTGQVENRLLLLLISLRCSGWRWCRAVATMLQLYMFWTEDLV